MVMVIYIYTITIPITITMRFPTTTPRQEKSGAGVCLGGKLRENHVLGRKELEMLTNPLYKHVRRLDGTNFFVAGTDFGAQDLSVQSFR